MKRRLFNMMAGLSLLLCIATAGLWIRSYIAGGVDWVWPAGPKWPPHRFHVGTARGDIAVDIRFGPLSKPVNSYWQTTPFTLIYGTMSGRIFFNLLMPLWMPTALFFLCPLIWARGYWMRPATLGRCP